MKLGYTILFSVIIFLSGSKNLLLMMDYSINQNFYESVCENKSKPEMHCHGKCQLTKDLQKTSKSFSMSNLGFDFQFHVVQNIAVIQTQFFLTVYQKIFPKSISIWSAISLGVPNPPPDFYFNSFSKTVLL